MRIPWILALYPVAWRERYQDEMVALLEQHPITWRTRLDLLRNALDARLDPHFKTPGRPIPLEGTLRHAHSTVFCAFPLLYLGFLFFLDELDDAFYLWNRAHPALWRFKLFANDLTYIAVLALLLTSLILACVLAGKALRSGAKERLRALLLGGVTATVAAPCLFVYAPAALFCLLLFSLFACLFTVAHAIGRGAAPRKALGYVLAPVTLALAGMITQTFYIAVWGLAIWKTPTQIVQQMALAANRHTLPGDLWRLQVVGGILWAALMTGVALWRFGRMLTTFLQKKTPIAV